MININKTFIVAKREYFEVVKKKSFWISTFVFPLFMILIGFVSGYSTQQAEESFEKVQKFDKNVKVIVVDETERIHAQLLEGTNFEEIENLDKGTEEVKSGNAEALFYYPQDLLKGEASIKVYRQHKSVIENANYNATAEALIRNGLLSNLSEQELLAARGELSTDVVAYENGEIKKANFGRFIIPAFVLFLYFIMVTFGSNYFLSSVSEEKESRMVEIILTSMNKRTLLLGKLIGLTSVVFTQIILLSAFAGAALLIGKTQLPINIGEIVIDPLQLVFSIICLITGFSTIANIMIGVGSAMPTLKEAQSFSSVFMILALFPLYFSGILVTSPNGTLAKVLSFTPITAPMILLFRNAFDVLSISEMIISVLILLAQLFLSLFLAVKLFEIGSLQYKEKISLKSLFKIIKTTF